MITFPLIINYKLDISATRPFSSSGTIDIYFDLNIYVEGSLDFSTRLIKIDKLNVDSLENLRHIYKGIYKDKIDSRFNENKDELKEMIIKRADDKLLIWKNKQPVFDIDEMIYFQAIDTNSNETFYIEIEPENDITTRTKAIVKYKNLAIARFRHEILCARNPEISNFYTFHLGNLISKSITVYNPQFNRLKYINESGYDSFMLIYEYGMEEKVWEDKESNRFYIKAIQGSDTAKRKFREYLKENDDLCIKLQSK